MMGPKQNISDHTLSVAGLMFDACNSLSFKKNCLLCSGREDVSIFYIIQTRIYSCINIVAFYYVVQWYQVVDYDDHHILSAHYK